MKRIIILILFCACGLLVFINACPPDNGKDKPINVKWPKEWPEAHYKFENNKPTIAGFELGRKLFYDPLLSKTGMVSCASCHQPFAAFSHIDHATSHGVNNRLGTRNAPALFNLCWQTSFFWDGGVNHIEVQPISPMTNPLEMDISLADAVNKIKADDEYKAMFKKAFKKDSIDSQQMLKAITQFMGMLMSNNSKYDKYMRHEKGGEMTAAELNGMTLVKENCGSCHKEPLFTDFSFRNNGLTPRYPEDSGRAKITRLGADLYKFKVPSLRNLKYTQPYMHDGRFTELGQVLDHYAHSKYDAPSLDPQMKRLFYFTESQRGDIIAFLNTLNDEAFVKDDRFKDPKNQKDMSNIHHTGQPKFN